MLLADADFQERRQSKVKADRKKTTFVFGFFDRWLLKILILLPQYWVNNRNFERVKLVFCAKYTLYPVNTQVKKIFI